MDSSCPFFVLLGLKGDTILSELDVWPFLSRSIQVVRYFQFSWRGEERTCFIRVYKVLTMSSLTSITMSSSRENSVYLAKLAEQAEPYEGQSPPSLPPPPSVLWS